MFSRVVLPSLPLLAVLILTAGCAREKVFTIRSFAPVPNKATRPVPVEQEWWSKRHQAIIDRNRQGNVDLILIGDSITHCWEDSSLWEEYFVPRNAVNMGYCADRTENVLWRLERGELDGISPKVAMVMIGTNNSNGDEYTAEQIADGIVAICRILRVRLPQTRILLLAIFPRGEKPGDPLRVKTARASHLASTVADGKTIVYMDINDRFLTSDGTLTTDVFPDLVHPKDKGYQIWVDAVLPKIDELMKAP